MAQEDTTAGERDSSFRLSVLDQAPIAEGMTGSKALHNTIDLARLAERLGYYRYWVAEHHGTPALASASPEALIGSIAGATNHLRVGSGGIMLPYYSPFKVAETFSMLSGLYPNRIDLGLGRAPGTDPATAQALRRDRYNRASEDFPEQLSELLGYIDGTLLPNHPFARLTASLPGRPETPEPWLLGSSPQSGIWAAEKGLPYMFADFISPTGASIARRYRAEFEPSLDREKPHVGVALWAICADTDEEARRLALSGQMLITLLHRGQLIPVPSVETARQFFEDAGYPPEVASEGRRTIVGSHRTVRAGIEAAVAEYNADEAMIVTITHDHAARRRSYELIADAFALTPP